MVQVIVTHHAQSVDGRESVVSKYTLMLPFFSLRCSSPFSRQCCRALLPLQVHR